MQHELRAYPDLVAYIQDANVREFLLGPDVPDTAFLLGQLDVVDKAACWWRHSLHGISLNVFRGFSTEDELVDYFLHDAYGDGVTVLASKFGECCLWLCNIEGLWYRLECNTG